MRLASAAVLESLAAFSLCGTLAADSGRPMLTQLANSETKSQNSVDFALGEVTVTRAALPGEGWKISIPFRPTTGGTLLTNWTALQMDLRDAAGHLASTSPIKHITNGWVIYNGWGRLDPTVGWRLKADFVMDSDFGSTNLYVVRVPTAPDGQVVTNLAGVPIRIFFPGGNMLAVRAQPEHPETAVTLVRVSDEDGNDIDEGTGAWELHSFKKAIRLPRAGEAVVVTLAIQNSLHLEFRFNPTVVKQGTANN